MRRGFKKILLFELCWKIFVICLANPLMNEFYQTYVASRGLSFNKNIISTFASIKGILIFTALFLCAAVLIFYEFSVVINMVELSRRGEDFTVYQVLRASVWNLSAFSGKGILPASVCYVLLLPFSQMGWINSVVPKVEVPYFIIGEMVRTTIGIVGVIAIYASWAAIYVLLLFVPVYMVLEQKTIGQAFLANLKRLRRMGFKCWLTAAGICAFWYFFQTEMAKYWRRNVLSYKDFDLNFYKYFVHSQAFRIDILYWFLYTLVITVMFVLSAWIFVGISGAQERAKVLCSRWENDLGTVLGITGKHLRNWLGKMRGKMRTKRYRAAASVLILGLAAYLYLTAGVLPYIHEPWAIGHRGCKDGIENTLTGIKAAARHGADYAEIDVQLSNDGVPVVVHDSNLWRLAGESVNVTDLTLEELKALDIRDKDHPGQTDKIPTLEEAIRTVQEEGTDMGLLIELKCTSENAEALAEAVMQLVEDYQFGEKAIFMSLYYETLYPITTRHPEWWVGYCIFGSSGNIDDSVWQYDIDFIASEENQISNQLVYQARAHSLPVYVWTVFDTEQMKQYLEMGITGIISDFPESAVEEIQKFNEKNGTDQYEWQREGYPKGI